MVRGHLGPDLGGRAGGTGTKAATWPTHAADERPSPPHVTPRHAMLGASRGGRVSGVTRARLGRPPSPKPRPLGVTWRDDRSWWRASARTRRRCVRSPPPVRVKSPACRRARREAVKRQAPVHRRQIRSELTLPKTRSRIDYRPRFGVRVDLGPRTRRQEQGYHEDLESYPDCRHRRSGDTGPLRRQSRGERGLGRGHQGDRRVRLPQGLADR